MIFNPISRKTVLTAGVSVITLCATALAVPTFAQTAATPAANGSDVVVVTARRKALLSADERKKNSDAIIDSVVADEAGKLPDNSITEVLQRVSGVSVVRFASLGDPDHYSAEGSGVQVRGLSGVAGRLNGREVFSANGGRGLSWGDVTPELMAAVDIYKSTTANLIEGGTGGTVDLRTKMPFDYKKPAFQANLGMAYGDLSDSYTPSGSFLVTKRWDTKWGEFGALFDFAASSIENSSNFIRMQPYWKTQVRNVGDRYIPGGITFGYDNYERDRNGVYAAFQWRPKDNLSFYTTLFESKYVEKAVGQGAFLTSNQMTIDPTLPYQFDENGGLVKGTIVTYRASDGEWANGVGGSIFAGGDTEVRNTENSTREWSTGFNWIANDDVKVSGALQFVDSTRVNKSYFVFPSITMPGSMTLDLTGDYPEVTLPGTAATLLSNKGLYRWNATQDHLERNHGFLGAANVDVDWKLSDTGFFRSLKMGARYAERTEHDGVGGYNWTALAQGWNGSPNIFFNSAGTRPGDVELVTFENFFRGETKLPTQLYLPSVAMVENFDPVSDHTTYGGLPQSPFGIRPNEYTNAYTKTSAVYVQANFASDTGPFGIPYKGNLGLRVVETENYSDGYFTQSGTTFVDDGKFYSVATVGQTLSTTTATLNKGGSKFTKFLPAFNIQFEPSSEAKLRFAYNITMDNQSINSLRANGNLSVTTIGDPTSTTANPKPNLFVGFNTSSGNPALKPTMSENIDVSYEWYKGRSFSAHVSLFHKSLSDLAIIRVAGTEVPVTYVQAQFPTTGTPQYSSAFVGTRTELAQSRTMINAKEDATIQGFEIGGRKFFDNLPGAFKGLGVEFNYTYIDSQNPGDLGFAIDNVISRSPTVGGTLVVDRDADLQPLNSHPLTDFPVAGLSQHSANLVGMYENGPWSVRLAYNWRSPYLMSASANGTNGSNNYFDYTNNKKYGIQTSLPNYSDEYGTVDFGMSYRFNSNYRLSMNASNLTNTVTKTLMGGYPNNGNYTRSWFVADQRITLGLSINY